MPKLLTTVLKDRAATPVDHTFEPADYNPATGVGIVAESSAVPIGRNRLSVSMRKLPSGKFRGIVQLAMPVVQDQVLNGISKPVVVRSAHANLEVTFDGASTIQERKNLIGIIQNALAPSVTLVDDALINLNGVW